MGYDTLLLLQPPDEEFLCQICYEVMENAVSICGNGHTCCRSCIGTWAEKHAKCPYCRGYLCSEPIPVRAVNNMIQRLPIRCSHHEQGCTWKGSVSKLYAHRHQCEYDEIQCTNEGCPTLVLRKELSTHQANCEFQRVLCAQCDIYIVRSLYSDHLTKTCNGRMVQCLRDGCGAHMRFDEMKKHSDECRFQYVDCPFDECPEQFLRKDVSHHQEKCKYRPIACTKCKSLVPKVYIDLHPKECPERPVRCPNKGCGQSLPASKLEQHRTKCGFEKILCPLYASCGCTERFPRHMQSQHFEQYMSHHMVLLTDTVVRLREIGTGTQETKLNVLQWSKQNFEVEWSGQWKGGEYRFLESQSFAKKNQSFLFRLQQLGTHKMNLILFVRQGDPPKSLHIMVKCDGKRRYKSLNKVECNRAGGIGEYLLYQMEYATFQGILVPSNTFQFRIQGQL